MLKNLQQTRLKLLQKEQLKKKISGNKYLAIVPANESKEKIKKHEELGVKSKI